MCEKLKVKVPDCFLYLDELGRFERLQLIPTGTAKGYGPKAGSYKLRIGEGSSKPQPKTYPRECSPKGWKHRAHSLRQCQGAHVACRILPASAECSQAKNSTSAACSAVLIHIHALRLCADM